MTKEDFFFVIVSEQLNAKKKSIYFTIIQHSHTGNDLIINIDVIIIFRLYFHIKKNSFFF